MPDSSSSTTPDIGIDVSDLITIIPPSTTSSGDQARYTILSASPTTPPRLQESRVASLPKSLVSSLSTWTLPTPLPPHLSNLTVVISPASGTRVAPETFTLLIEPLLKILSIPISLNQVHALTSATSLASLTRTNIIPRARTENRSSILLLSGDGGVADILNPGAGLDDEGEIDTDYDGGGDDGDTPEGYVPPVLALVPCGTANALFHSLQSAPENPFAAAMRVLLFGKATTLPTFTVTFPPGSRVVEPLSPEDSSVDALKEPAPPGKGTEFPVKLGVPISSLRGAVVFSWALHAALVSDSDTPEFRRLGSKRFGLAAQRNLEPVPKVYRGEVELVIEDERTGDDNYDGAKRMEIGSEGLVYLTVPMVGRLEKGFVLAPKSTPADGRLWAVWLPGKWSGEEIMRVMGGAYDGGGHVGMDKVGFESVKGLRLRSEAGGWTDGRICVDGRIVVIPKEGGEVSVRKNLGQTKGAFKVLL
ncbi:MAG: hypothetical protein M1814_000075 [Vezdaea aestivalis]|nr:MAG: hypothetical protein M1814_000075 [Vezdaea aestivalis]